MRDESPAAPAPPADNPCPWKSPPAGRRPRQRRILSIALAMLMAAGILISGCTGAATSADRAPDTSAGRESVHDDGREDPFASPERRRVFAEPGAPVRIEWDDDGDGTADAEGVCHPRTGQIEALRRRGPDGAWSAPVRPADVSGPHRTLVVMLDGIPWDMVRELWDEGELRVFHRPSRMVSVFPSMTDPAFGEMLCANPIPGYEASWFDTATRRIRGGNLSYFSGENEPWRRAVLYQQSWLADAMCYLSPARFAEREVRQSLAAWRAKRPDHAVWYFASSDAMAHMAGWRRCREYVRGVGRLLERLFREEGGRLRIAFLADHGNSFVPSARLPIEAALEAAGLRVKDSPAGRTDTVSVPALGMVSSVYVYADTDAARDRAEGVLAGFAGVDIVCRRLPDEGGVQVFRARHGDDVTEVLHRAGRYKLRFVKGDPLRHREAAGQLQRAGKLDADGFAGGDDWLAADVDGRYPDAPVRIARGLTGLTLHPADLLVGLEDGWYWGDRTIDLVAPLNGTHGALHAGNSVTFFTTTGPEGPDHFRQADMLRVVNAYFRFVPDFRGVRCSCLQRAVPGLKVGADAGK